MHSNNDLDKTIPYAEDSVDEIDAPDSYRIIINDVECGGSSDSEIDESENVQLFTHKFVPECEPAPFSTSFHGDEGDEDTNVFADAVERETNSAQENASRNNHAEPTGDETTTAQGPSTSEPQLASPIVVKANLRLKCASFYS